MPRFNKDLRDKGYIPVLPHLLYKAAPKRKEGYLEAVTSAALLVDGAFYLSQEDYGRIKDEYKLDADSNAEQPSVAEVETLKQRKRELEDRINEFLDLEKPCNEPEWQALRAAYEEEINKKTKEGCTNCQINSIRNKYRGIIRKL